MNTTTNHKQIMPSPEVLATFISSECETQEIKTDPKSYIFQKYNVAIKGDVDINIVENNQSEMHLALPYYEKVQDSLSTQKMTETELDNIEGGELFIVLLASLIGVGSLVGVAGVAMIGVEADKVVKNK